MLPTNSGHAKDKGCSPVSSNCVVWQGPDLSCIDLCNGDTVSDVIAKLALELCTLVEMFDLDEYDFSCLAIPISETPTDTGDLIQILIQRICALEGVTPTTDPNNPGSVGCPDNCIVPIASCFYSEDMTTGDMITTSSLVDYVNLIGNKICDILIDIVTLQNDVVTLQEQINDPSTGLKIQVEELDSDKASKSSLQYQLSDKTTAGAPTEYLPDATRQIENSLIRSQDAQGTPTLYYQNMIKAGNIDSEPKMFGIGNMSTIPTWTSNPQTDAEAMGNQWITIRDIREELQYLKQNLDTSGCASLFLNFRATIAVGMTQTLLTIFTDGSTGFTSQWKECKDGKTKVSVVDVLGNSTTFSVGLINLIGNPSGYSIDLTPTSVDQTQDITVTADTCFSNETSQSTCEKLYPYEILVSATCPANVLTVYTTSVSYNFNSTIGDGYIINIYPTGGSTPIASQIISTPSVIVSYTIFGLSAETTYDFEIVVIDSQGGESPCAKQTFITLPDDCTPPIGASAILTTP